jgi:hypothetical protein
MSSCATIIVITMSITIPVTMNDSVLINHYALEFVYSNINVDAQVSLTINKSGSQSIQNQ